MPHLRGANLVGHDDGGRLYAARTVGRRGPGGRCRGTDGRLEWGLG